MNKQLRHAVNIGITFGIITIFIFLIGFVAVAADLVAGILHNENGNPFLGLTPQVFDALIFLGLIGLWAGASGARKPADREDDPWSVALLSGLVTGLIHGLMVAIVALVVGVLNQNGVPITKYLSSVLPQYIEMFLANLPPIPGAIMHFLLLTITGVLGGVIARGLGRGSWRGRFSAAWRQRVDTFNQSAFMKNYHAKPVNRYIFYAAMLVILFLIPSIAGVYWNYNLGTIGIYVVLGLGLNIVVGLAGLLDLGYVAFFAIGAYTIGLLTAPTVHGLHWNFWLVLPLAVVLAAAAGLLLGAPVLRMRGDYLAIVTLGFGEIIRILSTSDDLTPLTGGPRGVPGIGGPTLFGHPFNTGKDFVYIIFLAVLLIIFVTNRLQNSRVGRAWEAMREDETVSRAMGINTLAMKLLAFGVGAAFAGLGGALFASRNQFTGPEDFTLMVSINVVAIVIVGGMGNIPGVIAGALVLKGLPEVLRHLQDYRVLVFGALLVVMMIWRPAGLIPSSRRKMDVSRDAGVIETQEEGRGG